MLGTNFMISGLIRKIILPKSHNKDKARKEFILNTLLLSALIITFFTFVVDVINKYYKITVQDGIAPQIIFIFFLFLLILFFLSKKGKEQLAAILLIIFFYFPATYTIYEWGAQIPIAWIIYALLIVMSGVLIGTRFAFFATSIIISTSSILAYQQALGLHNPDVSWLKVPYSFGDAVLLNITLVIIAIITWLYTKEIEKSLIRARISELELKKERDLLEIKVEERTKDLKQAQIEKITQLYRFAEMGRLSSGLFHDLVTPLSLISLHLERLKDKEEEGRIEDIQTQLKKAMKATKYLQSLVIGVRKQMQNEGLKKLFSINKETKLVMQILRHKAKNAQLTLLLYASKEVKLYGDKVKFNQLMINLLLNAIDAYEGVTRDEKEREIKVTVAMIDNKIVITIQDRGVGINKENINKIFLPFFTTKNPDKGTGIGLSMSRDIVEKFFDGTITVKSNSQDGTIFTLIFPQRKNFTGGDENSANISNNT